MLITASLLIFTLMLLSSSSTEICVSHVTLNHNTACHCYHVLMYMLPQRNRLLIILVRQFSLKDLCSLYDNKVTDFLTTCHCPSLIAFPPLVTLDVCWFLNWTSMRPPLSPTMNHEPSEDSAYRTTPSGSKVRKSNSAANLPGGRQVNLHSN